jgi:predicted nucleic acid-binding protein
MAEHWVLNASPVILLAKCGLIEAVPRLADPLVIPQPVADEIFRGEAQDPAVQWLRRAGPDYIRPAVAEHTALSPAEIGPGERAVISWALAHNGFVAILDDAIARNRAERLGATVMGTVGVLLALKKAGLIREVRPHLMDVRRVGGHISDSLFGEALKRAGEV